MVSFRQVIASPLVVEGKKNILMLIAPTVYICIHLFRSLVITTGALPITLNHW